MKKTHSRNSRKTADSSLQNEVNPLVIVGIGASAGGLNALQRVLSGLPSTPNVAYVVVQHLSPHYPSELPSILQNYTDLTVQSIKDGEPLNPGRIYVAPPDGDVTVSGDRFQVNKTVLDGPSPSIDGFLTSLSTEKGPHAVGIILSGSGSDGALGIRAIKANDGITMAQSAETSGFDSMPLAAMSTGQVDFVLDPEKIGEELKTALAYPDFLRDLSKPPSNDAIAVILNRVMEQTGANFSGYKYSTIHRRIRRRMAIRKINRMLEYIDYIQEHPDELHALQQDLLISVTDFFRNPEAFVELKKIVQHRLEKKRDEGVFRIWVPGCSTGEEAYSIAIMMAEILDAPHEKPPVQIFATDLDAEAIRIARKGVFPVSAIRGMDDLRIQHHFSRYEDTVFIAKHIRDMVVFARHDLIKETPFMHLDMISCRNLLIYLDTELQDKLMSIFHYSLHPGGLLFLGKSESINNRTKLFESLNTKWKIFQRKEGPSQKLPIMMHRHLGHLLDSRRKNLIVPGDKDQRQDYEWFRSLIGALNVSAVVVDENAKILHIRGDIDRYIVLQGDIRNNFNLLEVTRPEIRYNLQTLLNKFAKDAPKTLTGNTIVLGQGETVQIIISAIRKEAPVTHRLVVFMPGKISPPVDFEQCTDTCVSVDHVHDLERELVLTRDHLQDTMQELATSSQELQSLNEELQSSNQELQATNEELETSNEELQASNEELHTVNDELRAKSDEAARLLTDLKASEQRYRLLIDNMNEAVMLCELEYGPGHRPTDLIIRQANVALQQLINIDEADMPLRAGSANLSELVTDEMLDCFRQIMESGVSQRFEVQLGAHQKALLLSVYGLGEGRFGVVCRDDTARKRAVDALAVSERQYRELVETANSIIIRWSPDGRIRYINEFGLEFFGYSREELIGRNVMTIVPAVEKSTGRDLKALVASIAKQPDQHPFVRSENVRKDGRTVWVGWTNKAIIDGQGAVSEILAIGNDITPLKNSETALRQSEREQVRQRQFLETLLDTAKMCIAVMRGSELRYMLVNEAYQQLRPELKMVGRLYREVFPAAVESGAEALVRSVIETGKVQMDFGYPVPIPGKPDATWDHQIVRLPVVEGEAPSALILTWDSTEHNRAKKQLKELNESLEELVSERTALAEKRSRQLQRLSVQLIEAEERERRRIAQLLHDDLQQVLAGAKMQLQAVTEKLPLEKTLLKVEQLLEQSLAKSRSIVYELSPPLLNHAGLVPSLEWLIEQLKQQYGLDVSLVSETTRQYKNSPLTTFIFRSVRELLFNVLKHAGVKRAGIRLFERGGHLVVTVEDNGVGFDNQKAGDDPKQDGFGLLSLAEQTISLGGLLQIETAPGHGCLINISVPAAVEEPIPEPNDGDEEKEPPVRDERSEVAPSEALRVLFVDDHDLMRQGLMRLMKKQSGIVAAGEASDGKRALELARQIRPDVVIMDVSMPVMNGIDATRQLKTEMPAIRVIGLTMHGDDHVMAQMIEAGAETVINKTDSPGRLLSAIYGRESDEKK